MLLLLLIALMTIFLVLEYLFPSNKFLSYSGATWEQNDWYKCKGAEISSDIFDLTNVPPDVGFHSCKWWFTINDTFMNSPQERNFFWWEGNDVPTEIPNDSAKINAVPRNAKVINNN